MSLLQRLTGGQGKTQDLPASPIESSPQPRVDEIPLKMGASAGLKVGTMTARPTEPASAASVSEPRSTEQSLSAAMDEEMLAQLQALKETDPETGQPLMTMRERRETVRLVMDYMVKSKRLKPDEVEDEPKGVSAMREYISAARTAKPPARPRKVVDAEEGSALAKALKVKK